MGKYEANVKVPQTAPTILVVCLLVLAALMALGGIFAGVFKVMSVAPGGQIDLETALWAVGFLLAGVLPGCVLWAGAWIVRQLYCASRERQEIIESVVESGQRSRQAGKPALAAAVEVLGRIETAIGEINPNAPRSVQQHQTAQEVPDDRQVAQLTQRADEGSSDASVRRIRQARSRIDELIAAGELDEAQVAAHELLIAEGGSEQAAALVEKVEQQVVQRLDQHRREMYSQIQQAAKQRQWGEALHIARQLVGAYPDSSEAQITMSQIPTLEDNARIEEVRRLRDQICDQIIKRQFASVCKLAADVVDRFPRTAAATDLRKQLPKLKELARAQKA